MVAEDLIYDIGANDGSDTDFYFGEIRKHSFEAFA